MVLTSIIVFAQVMLVNNEIVVFVQFPKFAVNHVEVFIRKVLCNLVDVFFFIKQSNNSQEVTLPEFGGSNPSTPTSIDTIKDPRDHLIKIIFAEDSAVHKENGRNDTIKFKHGFRNSKVECVVILSDIFKSV
jgi:hypothetical protein